MSHSAQTLNSQILKHGPQTPKSESADPRLPNPEAWTPNSQILTQVRDEYEAKIAEMEARHKGELAEEKSRCSQVTSLILSLSFEHSGGSTARAEGGGGLSC